MAKFVISFEGRGGDRETVDCEELDDARNEAVRRLGAYLIENPAYASDGHWRVNVENGVGQGLLHVIVAAVPVRNSRESSR